VISVSAKGGGDEEVVQPVCMVAVTVEAFRGALPTLVLFRGGGMPRSEVVQQGPGTAVLIRDVTAAVQVLTTVEVPVHRTHQAVQHVTGAVCSGWS